MKEVDDFLKLKIDQYSRVIKTLRFASDVEKKMYLYGISKDLTTLCQIKFGVKEVTSLRIQIEQRLNSVSQRISL